MVPKHQPVIQHDQGTQWSKGLVTPKTCKSTWRRIHFEKPTKLGDFWLIHWIHGHEISTWKYQSEISWNWYLEISDLIYGKYMGNIWEIYGKYQLGNINLRKHQLRNHGLMIYIYMSKNYWKLNLYQTIQSWSIFGPQTWDKQSTKNGVSIGSMGDTGG